MVLEQVLIRLAEHPSSSLLSMKISHTHTPQRTLFYLHNHTGIYTHPSLTLSSKNLQRKKKKKKKKAVQYKLKLEE